MAEYVLERRARTVLDVGCGEGRWQPLLRRLRPALSYTGIDSSDYAVRRYGRLRGIRRGTFAELDRCVPLRHFDIIVVSDVIHYLRDDELQRGSAALARRLGGIAYLDFFTTRDGVEGDLDGMIFRSPSWYRAQFARHGLINLGMQFYATRDTVRALAAMERPTL
jgi:SAM-dependent methyltransferase